MIVSHAWVRAFVPHERSAADVGTLLSRHTVTLDDLVSLRADLAPFVVGLVVEAAPHPDSDHLSVTKVDDGTGELVDVVCGAPNVTAGTKYPFARVGTTMPGGLVIAKRKIRGQTSAGMLCSARELGLGEEHDGILALDTDAPPGTPLLDVLDVGDVQLDLDVLPNRPDLLSHLGVAREVAALTGVPMRVPAELPLEPGDDALGERARGDTEASADGVTVRVADRVACPRYLGVVIRGVEVAPSPAWLVERLAAIGVRSINNIVDATNYVLHGLGQPVHAFDLDRLAKHEIVVRPVTDGESLVTLDGVKRLLPSGTTVICDGERPTALAGVMGGEASEVTNGTTNLLVEIANFSPRFVRSVRRTVQLSTDASYRFERGIDAGYTETAARTVAALIRTLAGGEITAFIDVGAAPAAPTPVRLRASRTRKLLGAELTDDAIIGALDAIGCTFEDAERASTWQVTPPTWRHDLLIEEDLIEEVARIIGFDALPDRLQPARPSAVPDDALHLSSRRVRDVCLAWGMYEARPMPFVATGPDALRVRNPLADDEPYLRGALLDTLAGRAEYNLSRMLGNVRLFEIGTAFADAAGRLPREEWRVAALLMGASRPPHFTEPEPPPYDAWDAKALGEALARAAYPGATVALEPRSDGVVGWTVRADDDVVGHVGAVSLDRPVWAAEAWGVELTLGVVSSDDVAAPGEQAHDVPVERPRSRWASVRYEPLPVTPASHVDLALLVPVSTPAAAVEALLRAHGGELLERVELFDRYEGKGVPEGHRSLAWRLTWRHPERTLRDKEIEGRRAKLLATLERELGVRPRI